MSVLRDDDACEVLRIIAGVAKLSDDDRNWLRTAADQLEFAQRDLIQSYARLIETQQQLAAVNDRLIAERRERWRLSTGWVSGQVERASDC